jgi:hypothetical protein
VPIPPPHESRVTHRHGRGRPGGNFGRCCKETPTRHPRKVTPYVSGRVGRFVVTYGERSLGSHSGSGSRARRGDSETSALSIVSMLELRQDRMAGTHTERSESPQSQEARRQDHPRAETDGSVLRRSRLCRAWKRREGDAVVRACGDGTHDHHELRSGYSVRTAMRWVDGLSSENELVMWISESPFNVTVSATIVPS